MKEHPRPGVWTCLRHHAEYAALRVCRRHSATLAVLWLVAGVFFLSSRQSHSQWWRFFRPDSLGTHRMHPLMLPALAPRIPCQGPRGRLLSDSPDDELQFGKLTDISYPVPILGSHRELGIEQTWMTADGRYGPYGYGETEHAYDRTRVDWDRTDWGKLQDQCLEQNSPRFPNWTPSVPLRYDTRFTWKNRSAIDVTPSWDAFNVTRRTALVIRAYSGFQYKPEDLWNIRSIIAEAALRTGGEYTVVMLVHIQERERNIFQSKEAYDAAFEAARIPSELQSIAVLWDDHLLESWYEAVEEHKTEWQVNQPLQLFALHYPEFDHCWQIELDQRILGDVGEYLDTVASFARNEPRKQALERATYAFNEQTYGTYKEFMYRVDMANNGQSRAWGPIRIPDIDPIGPKLPALDLKDDEFMWGVGEDADVVVTSFCADVLQTQWVYDQYIKGFADGGETPRWFCPPAVMRASRSLLLSVHRDQLVKGLSIPSEAVLPSWALWHGLKLSYPPQPGYLDPLAEKDDAKVDLIRNSTSPLNAKAAPWLGSTTEKSPDGLSHCDPQSFADRGMTWWWTSGYPRRIMDAWLAGKVEDESVLEVLSVQDGKVYMPNLAMHPVKS